MGRGQDGAPGLAISSPPHAKIVKPPRQDTMARSHGFQLEHLTKFPPIEDQQS